MSIKTIVDEFGAGKQAPHKMSELYRGGAFVKLFDIKSITVPSAGRFAMSAFRGTAKSVTLSPKLHLFPESLEGIGSGGTISSWNGATAYSVGMSLPTVQRTETHPFVRFGNGLTVNNSVGNYLDFGPQSFPMLTNNGLTFVGAIRLNIPNENFERVFDFGRGINADNVLLGEVAGSTYVSGYRNGTISSDHGMTTVTTAWNVVAIRFRTGEKAFWVGGNKTTYPNLTVTDKNFLQCYVAKSAWPDPYSNMDMREAMWYDRGLSDADVLKVITYLSTKYA